MSPFATWQIAFDSVDVEFANVFLLAYHRLLHTQLLGAYGSFCELGGLQPTVWLALNFRQFSYDIAEVGQTRICVVVKN